MRMKGGQSLYEIVIAVGFVALILVALVALTVTTQKNTNLAKNRAEAARLVQDANEWLRGERDTNWQLFYQRAATATWCVNAIPYSWNRSGNCSGPISNTNFTRHFYLTQENINSVRAEIVVSWTDQGGVHETRVTTYLTNWKRQ